MRKPKDQKCYMILSSDPTGDDQLRTLQFFHDKHLTKSLNIDLVLENVEILDLSPKFITIGYHNNQNKKLRLLKFIVNDID